VPGVQVARRPGLRLACGKHGKARALTPRPPMERGERERTKPPEAARC